MKAYLRPIAHKDNEAVAALIRTVMPEFGASGEGFAIMDPEVSAMFEAYQKPRSGYAVIESDEFIIGGAGIAPLKDGDPDICEVQKMYLLSSARGHGLGRQLMDWCLAKARAEGFKRCYAETLASMTAACHLYEKAGFKPVPGPLGSTGHHKCNRWYVLQLEGK